MISKVSTVKSASAFNIKSLTDYLKTGHKDDQKDEKERVKNTFTLNMYSDDIDTATQEMMYTASLNKRSEKSKYMHLVLSLSEGEKVTEEQWKNIAKDYLKEVGMDGHQAYAVHHNDNGKEHIHLVINRINPTTHARVNDYLLFKKLQKFDEKIEKKYNLKQFEHIKNYAKKAERIAKNIEVNSEHQSFISYLLEHKEEIKNSANSWQELQKKLKEFNCEIRIKGKGLIIKSLDSKNQEEVKASTFDRDFSYAKLVKRLGFYPKNFDEIKDQKPKKTYEKKPITENAKRIEYSRYLIERIEKRNDKVIDKGDRLIAQKVDNYQSIQDMLKIAKKRFGDGNIRVTGNKDFQRRMAYQALKLGIKINLTDEQVKKDYENKLRRIELEKAQQTKQNQVRFNQEIERVKQQQLQEKLRNEQARREQQRRAEQQRIKEENSRSSFSRSR